MPAADGSLPETTASQTASGLLRLRVAFRAPLLIRLHLARSQPAPPPRRQDGSIHGKAHPKLCAIPLPECRPYPWFHQPDRPLESAAPRLLRPQRAPPRSPASLQDSARRLHLPLHMAEADIPKPALQHRRVAIGRHCAERRGAVGSSSLPSSPSTAESGPWSPRSLYTFFQLQWLC